MADKFLSHGESIHYLPPDWVFQTPKELKRLLADSNCPDAAIEAKISEIVATIADRAGQYFTEIEGKYPSQSDQSPHHVLLYEPDEIPENALSKPDTFTEYQKKLFAVRSKIKASLNVALEKKSVTILEMTEWEVMQTPPGLPRAPIDLMAEILEEKFRRDFYPDERLRDIAVEFSLTDEEDMMRAEAFTLQLAQELSRLFKRNPLSSSENSIPACQRIIRRLSGSQLRPPLVTRNIFHSEVHKDFFSLVANTLAEELPSSPEFAPFAQNPLDGDAIASLGRAIFRILLDSPRLKFVRLNAPDLDHATRKKLLLPFIFEEFAKKKYECDVEDAIRYIVRKIHDGQDFKGKCYIYSPDARPFDPLWYSPYTHNVVKLAADLEAEKRVRQMVSEELEARGATVIEIGETPATIMLDDAHHSSGWGPILFYPRAGTKVLHGVDPEGFVEMPELFAESNEPGSEFLAPECQYLLAQSGAIAFAPFDPDSPTAFDVFLRDSHDKVQEDDTERYKRLQVALYPLLANRFLHQRGLLHGDIKPSNIGIKEKEGVHIGFLGDKESIRHARKFFKPGFCTREYSEASYYPLYLYEQISQNLPLADEKTDTFSWALTLTEFWSGRKATLVFNSIIQNLDNDILALITMTAPDKELERRESKFVKAILKILGDAPKEFTDLITKMLSADREKRPLLSEVIARLHAIISEAQAFSPKTISAAPPPPAPQPPSYL